MRDRAKWGALGVAVALAAMGTLLLLQSGGGGESTTIGFGTNDNANPGIFSDPYLSIGGARFKWKDVEPADDSWSWDGLDAYLNAAKEANKWAANSIMFKSLQAGRICATLEVISKTANLMLYYQHERT